MELNAAGRRLRAALGFLQLPPRAPELRLLHRWLDNWPGVGALAAGLHRVGYDLSLIQHAGEEWNATFFVTGRMHSIRAGGRTRRRRGARFNARAGTPSGTPSGSFEREPCSGGVTFCRWVPPVLAAEALAALARRN